MKLQIADCRLRIGVLVLALLAGGCAAGSAFRQGDTLMRAGNLDEAVAAYRKAAQAAPNNATYRITLQRAMQAASRAHLEKAHEFEKDDQLEAALGEYKAASEYEPSNRTASAKVAELDRTIRDRIEASRPKPAIQGMRERARAASAEPILNPASREPLNFHFNNVSLRDILNAIGAAHGISVSFDREFADRPATVNLEGLSLEPALNQIMTMNQLSYKVLGEKSIFVFQDIPTKHVQFDDQVIRTFYLSHADATEIQQILSTIIRLPGIAVQPAIAGNKTANTITVRGTTSVVGILEKIIEQNDKPRAEVVIDVEILEVDRSKTKTYGLNLSEYALGGVFSPETSPSSTTATAPTGATGGTGGTTSTNNGTSTTPSGVKSPPPFNLNTISRGVSTSDFYLAVPTAIVRFLESDTNTKVIAKPQLRGAEGTKLTLNLGQRIPVISTSYTPIATGGAGVNPLSSYQYQDIGVNVDMTPTVTLDGDIRLDLTLDNSQLGPDTNVGGVTVPSFVQRKVSTRLRLRDGESNLLAGLLQTNDSKTVAGFPGLIHVPFLSDLFASNAITSTQTEIVMLLTPHIVRTHEITEADLRPIFIGSQQSLGVGGPPPLIAPQQPDAAPPAAAAPAAGVSGQPAGSTPVANPPVRGPGGTTLVAPPGSSPVPGTVLLPAPSPPAQQPAVQPPPAVETPLPVAPAATQPPPAEPTPAAVPTTSPGIGSAQVLISPPGTTFRVGGGPYTVPLLINDATRISTVTLTLLFDPTKLRVNRVQEGSFLRAGGVPVVFTQSVNGNRIDISLTRGADSTGASGTGVLSAILFDAIAPGPATLTLSGIATGPGGAVMGLRFTPVTVTVQ
ncbi:MAG: hypothetical protein ACRD2I_18270 [Vicinamibacterales bacterium]